MRIPFKYKGKQLTETGMDVVDTKIKTLNAVVISSVDETTTKNCLKQIVISYWILINI